MYRGASPKPFPTVLDDHACLGRPSKPTDTLGLHPLSSDKGPCRCKMTCIGQASGMNQPPTDTHHGWSLLKNGRPQAFVRGTPTLSTGNGGCPDMHATSTYHSSTVCWYIPWCTYRGCLTQCSPMHITGGAFGCLMPMDDTSTSSPPTNGYGTRCSNKAHLRFV